VGDRVEFATSFGHLRHLKTRARERFLSTRASCRHKRSLSHLALAFPEETLVRDPRWPVYKGAPWAKRG
jgi:hypothetical protein